MNQFFRKHGFKILWLSWLIDFPLSGLIGTILQLLSLAQLRWSSNQYVSSLFFPFVFCATSFVIVIARFLRGRHPDQSEVQQKILGFERDIFILGITLGLLTQLGLRIQWGNSIPHYDAQSEMVFIFVPAYATVLFFFGTVIRILAAYFIKFFKP